MSRPPDENMTGPWPLGEMEIEERTEPITRPEQVFARARLEQMGVYIRILSFGVFSPPSYILRYGSIDVAGVSWDMALLSFIEELLKQVPPAKE
jgi:hypothetical protein